MYVKFKQKKPKSIIFGFSLLLFSQLSHATVNSIVKDAIQSSSKIQKTITGTVTDDNGRPLPGATVKIKGTNNGVLTNLDGEFSIEARQGDILQISYLGFQTYEVSVSSESDISIQLQTNTSELNEIVVIGYGTQKKSDLTGAVSSVSSEELNKGLVNSPGQLLQGKVAGVNVTSASGEPGSGQNITIRGVGSLRSGSSPLYVVDGFALDNSNSGVPTSPLNFINPQDIQSIDVLKDASATAIYGARAANGVIVITTKKGKEGRTKIRFNSSLAISNLANEIDVFSADEFRSQVNAIGGTLDDGGANTNWQEELSRTGISHKIGLSLSGGNQNTTYFASAYVNDQEGILNNSNLKRYSGRVNLTQKMWDDRLKIEFHLVGTRVENERPLTSTIVGDMLTMNPTYAAYTNGEPTTSFPNGAFNPLIRERLYGDYINSNRTIINISPSLKIIEGLTYKLNLGLDYSTTNRDIQNIANALPLEDGNLTTIYTNNHNKLIENYLTYDLDLEKHDLSFLVGHTYQETFVHQKSWSYRVFPTNGIEPRYQIEAAGETFTPSSYATKDELQSFFGRINYNYDDRYLLTGTFRADGSSKFGENNKYGYFPSVAVGWRISQEDFMSSSNVFSNLKLRASWGQTGNQQIPSKITQASFQNSTGQDVSYPLNDSGNYPVGTIYTRLANPDIQWEVSTQTNIGLDFGFLNGALSGTVNYFNKVSNNILLEVTPADPVQPTSTYWTNIPDMEIINSGLEVALDYSHATATGFSYSIGGNASFIKNTVENSPFKVLATGSAQGPGLTGATVNGYINGEPIGTFYMKEFIGIDDDGFNQFRDANGDGQDTDDDRVAVGTALPNFNYAFYLNFNYKNFDLGLNFNGVAGNKIFNNTALTSFTVGDLSLSSNTTKAAVAYPNESFNNTSEVSTRYLEDGSYLRLNNATLGYSLNPGLIGLKNGVKSIRLSITGQNLFVITDYKGYDPEVNIDYSTGGVQSFGIDYNSYPKARTILFGLQVNL